MHTGNVEVVEISGSWNKLCMQNALSNYYFLSVIMFSQFPVHQIHSRNKSR